MTVAELKKHPGYQFEHYLSKELSEEDGWDEWGAGFCWLNGDIGVEYNFCFHKGEEDYSAIYYMHLDDNDYMATDHDRYIPYEIDFSDENWEEKFEDAMCKALIELHNL